MIGKICCDFVVVFLSFMHIIFIYLGVMFPIVPVVDRFRCESIELTLFNVGECCPIVGEAGLFFQG